VAGKSRDSATTLGQLFVMHAPRDETVGIDNASRSSPQQRHPKSFVSLDDADHLLSRPQDASHAAGRHRRMGVEVPASPAQAARVQRHSAA
jgi:putative redox protein